MADGRVTIETGLDSSGLQRGLQGISRSAGNTASSVRSSMGSISPVIKRVGATVAAAFSVRALVNFGKQAIDTASDLQEVQNVVDVAFGSMSYKMENFADQAIKTYGISKLTAKQTGSTYMAMANGMGIADEAASNMAVNLTGLSADMASFYNVRQDVTSTALKSIFTGETETLKQFGIVMTQTNLQQFAYQQGITKSVQKMTQAEQTQLRYAYVMQQTKLAQGDFARTQDSWANQTRILSETWKEFVGVLGSGLLVVLTPIVKLLNTILGQILEIANAVSDLFGWDPSKQADGSKKIASSLGKQAKATDKATTATKKNEKATKKAAKTAKGAVGSFDKLNIITTQDDSSKGTGSSGGGGVGTPDVGGISDNAVTNADTYNKKLSGILSKAKLLKSIFEEQFQFSLGDWQTPLSNIKKNIQSIKTSLSSIFTNPEVTSGLAGMSETFVGWLGSLSGSALSMGLTIGQNLTGGIAGYLSQNKTLISSTLVDIMANVSSAYASLGSLYAAIANIFTVFRGENATGITQDLVTIFANSALGIADIFSSIRADFTDMVVTPIVDNQEKIKTALDKTLAPVKTVLDAIASTVTNTMTQAKQMYDTHISPLFESLGQGLSEILSTLLDVYNEKVAPVLDILSAKLADLWTTGIQPMLSNVLSLVGSVADMLKALWENVLVPLIKWIIKNIVPKIIPIVQAVYATLIRFAKNVTKIISSVVDTLKGIVTFITGVLSGDWKKAWKGIVATFKGIFNTVGNIAQTALEAIITVIATVAISIGSAFSAVVTTIKAAFKGIGTWFTDNVWTPIKNVFANVGTFFSNKFTGGVKKIKGAFDKISEFFSGVWAGIKKPFSSVSTWFETTFSKAWQAVKDVFSKGGKVFDGIKDGILNGLKVVVNALIDGINKIIEKPFKGINGMIKKLKGVKILSGVMKNVKEFDVPQIPKLATGAVIPPNKEFLAVLGDQKRGTNIEAPLDTIVQAFQKVAGNMGSTGGDIVINIDGREVFRVVQQRANEEYKRTGKPAFNI